MKTNKFYILIKKSYKILFRYHQKTQFCSFLQCKQDNRNLEILIIGKILSHFIKILIFIFVQYILIFSIFLLKVCRYCTNYFYLESFYSNCQHMLLHLGLAVKINLLYISLGTRFFQFTTRTTETFFQISEFDSLHHNTF